MVRVQGKDRDRAVIYNDTPQGQYEILGWRKTGPGTNYNTVSFGKNPLLAQHYLGGEGGALVMVCIRMADAPNNQIYGQRMDVLEWRMPTLQS